jgi:hypothetical protein
MAKKPAAEQDEIELGKMCRMTVRNYRGIGSRPVIVDLDSIFVFVRPNNTGKSAILRAYEIAMLDGSKAGHLDKDDFPNANIDPENLPTIELETEVIGNPPAKKWIINDGGKRTVRERWVWTQAGQGKRQGAVAKTGRRRSRASGSPGDVRPDGRAHHGTEPADRGPGPRTASPHFSHHLTTEAYWSSVCYDMR